MTTPEPFNTFQDGMKALENLVQKLEHGDLPIEEALEAFERGVGIIRQLNERLTTVEARIEVLSRSPEGELKLEPVEARRGQKE